MGRLFLMTQSTMRNGLGTMLVLMSVIGAMIGLAATIDLETLKEEGRTCRTAIFRTRVCQTMHLI